MFWFALELFALLSYCLPQLIMLSCHMPMEVIHCDVRDAATHAPAYDLGNVFDICLVGWLFNDNGDVAGYFFKMVDVQVDGGEVVPDVSGEEGGWQEVIHEGHEHVGQREQVEHEEVENGKHDHHERREGRSKGGGSGEGVRRVGGDG